MDISTIISGSRPISLPSEEVRHQGTAEPNW
ncbi:Uncharacterised protein [Yersinia similis]|nr:Uncharacterised protein [Yersinia similis]